MRLFKRKRKPSGEIQGPLTPPGWAKPLSIEELNPWAGGNRLYNAPYEYSYHDGDKFFNGFGYTQIQLTDYWTLRQRSAQLFNENLYARGIIRRLLTNEINTGLCLEATPDEEILGREEDSLGDWAEEVETRFILWARSIRICDFEQQCTFYGIQKKARMEALVTGDCLIVLRQTPRTRLPTIQLISGNKVQTPLGTSGDELANGNRIRYGVEIDSNNRHVAYHSIDDKGVSTRIRAYGQRSGRRMAWLIYGTEKRLEDVRGQPLLSLVLQSLKEIDRYRDAAQRKAVVNSFLAMFIEKNTDKQGTLPITGGAVRRDQIMTDTVGDDTGDRVRNYDIASHIPGLVVEELQEGEIPKAFGSDGTDNDFGPFEHTLVQGIGWALEIPPEILTLSFNANYSASQAAINEFKLYQNRIRTDIGENFCQPIYTDWLISSVLNDRVQADGFLEVWRDPMRYDEFAAWLMSDWSGAIKLSTDVKKQAEGYLLLNQQGWITNERASRELTGTKWRKNMKRLRKEQELKNEIFGSMDAPAEETAADVVPLREVQNG